MKQLLFIISFSGICLSGFSQSMMQVHRQQHISYDSAMRLSRLPRIVKNQEGKYAVKITDNGFLGLTDSGQSIIVPVGRETIFSDSISAASTLKSAMQLKNQYDADEKAFWQAKRKTDSAYQKKHTYR